MGMRKDWEEPTPEEIELIEQCREARRKYQEELRAMPANRSRMNAYRDRAQDLAKWIKELSDTSLARKFEVPVWFIRREL